MSSENDTKHTVILPTACLLAYPPHLSNSPRKEQEDGQIFCYPTVGVLNSPRIAYAPMSQISGQGS